MQWWCCCALRALVCGRSALFRESPPGAALQRKEAKARKQCDQRAPRLRDGAGRCSRLSSQRLQCRRCVRLGCAKLDIECGISNWLGMPLTPTP